MKLFILGILGYCILEMSSAGVEEWISDEWWKQAQIVMDAVVDGQLETFNMPKDIATDGSVVKLWHVASRGKSTNTHTLDIELAVNFFFSMITSTSIASSPISSSHYYAMFEKSFESLDSNGDNRIDFTEFKIILNILALVEARMVIEAYDEDANNVLDRVEMNRMMDRITKRLASNHPDKLHYIIEQFEKPPIMTILSDNERLTTEQLVELFIGMWDPLVLHDRYQKLEKKLCVPNRAFRGFYTDKYSAMMDCVKNKKCAMIHNRGCIEDGNGLFQLCTGIFRDLRGKTRQQPLPSSRSCVLKKVF